MESITKILILDDQPEIREIISDIINMNFDEVEIDEAEDFDQALKFSNEKKYNVLLVDINLGGKSGEDFIKEVRESEGNNQASPIFVITGSPRTIEGNLEKYSNILLFDKVDGIQSLTESLSSIIED